MQSQQTTIQTSEPAEIGSQFNYQHFADYQLNKKQIRNAVAYAALVAIYRDDMPRFTRHLDLLKKYATDVLKQKILAATTKRETLREEITTQLNRQMKDEFDLEINIKEWYRFELTKDNYQSSLSLLKKMSPEMYDKIYDGYETLTDTKKREITRAIRRFIFGNISDKLNKLLTEEENNFCKLNTFIEGLSIENIYPEDAEHVDIFSDLFKKSDLEQFFSSIEKHVADEIISFVLTSKEYAITISYCKNATPQWTLINPDQSSVQKVEAKELSEKIYEAIAAKDLAGCIIEMYCEPGKREAIIQTTHEWREQAHDLAKLAPREPNNDLFEAINANKTHRVNQLLAAKADPNSRDDKGITAVMAAVLNNKSEILKSLIDHKANVTIADGSGQTALHKAAEKGHYELMDTLLVSKADINARTKDGETPLYTAIDNGKIDTTKYLLSAKANPNLSLNDGWTPLLLAAANGLEITTQSLILAKANIHQSRLSLSPLYYAAQQGHLNTLKILLKAGAKISLLAQSDKGLTPLSAAAQTGKLDVVEYLLEEKVDMDLTSTTGRSAIFQAAIHSKKAVFNILLKARADLHLSDTNGYTLLHAAVSGGKSQIIQSVIDAKLDINAQNSEGFTPLMLAATNKNNEAILTLLKAGANPNIKSSDNETPLHYAVYHEQPDMVKSLLEYKAKPDQRFSSGVTLLSYAKSKENIVIEKALSAAGASHIPSSQLFFIKPMQKTGLKGFQGDGVCFGLVCMVVQAYFSGGLQKLSEQVESIARTPIDKFKSFNATLKENRKKWLQRALAEVSDELTKETGHILTAETLWLNHLTPAEIKILLNITEALDELTLRQKFSRFLMKKVHEKVREYRATEIEAHAELEIPYLFEGVDTYMYSPEYLDLYPKGSVVDNQNFLQTLPIFSPKSLDPEEIAQLDCINGIYTKRELEFYFSSLCTDFKKYPGKIAFKFGNFHHFIVLFPSPTASDEWQLLDPNEMPINTISSKELAKRVLACFDSKQVASLHLEILVNNKDMDIAKECIKQWKSNPTWQTMQTVTPHKARMTDEFKTSFLRFAVMYNDLPLIKKILDTKVDPNIPDKDGHTALRLAAQTGKVEIIKLLQAHGATLDPIPLHVAIQVGQLETVKYLLNEKVDVNTETNHGTTSLNIAAYNNRVDILPILLEAKADIQHYSSLIGATPLALAAEEGHVEMVKALLDMKADVNTIGKQYGSALYCAAQNGHTEVLQMLTDAKADLSFSYQGNTPLMIAVKNGHTEIVKNLLKIQPEELNNRFGYYDATLLMKAVQCKQYEVAKFLLEAKADPNIVSSTISALYLAVDNKSFDMVKFLLESGADPKQCDSRKTSTLEHAIQSERTDIASILLKYGAKPTDDCLFYAVIANDTELVQLLLLHGSDPSLQIVQTPPFVRYYLEQHHPDAVTWFEEYLKENSLEDAVIIEISALELATIIGNEKMIQSLQNPTPLTSRHIFWSKAKEPILASEPPIKSLCIR